jgi:hypothetical protein
MAHDPLKSQLQAQRGAAYQGSTKEVASPKKGMSAEAAAAFSCSI